LRHNLSHRQNQPFEGRRAEGQRGDKSAFRNADHPVQRNSETLAHHCNGEVPNEALNGDQTFALRFAALGICCHCLQTVPLVR
jgi:hypothetical protein